MNNSPLHTTMLLQALISMLQDEGITINTAAAIQIEKVLFHSDPEVYDTFSKLKYRIVPIISRNKEEQDLLYKIFNKLDSKLIIEKPWVTTETFTSDGIIKKEPVIKPKKYRSLIFAGLLIIVTALIFWVNRNQLAGKPEITEPDFHASKDEIVVGDTVQFFTATPDSAEQSRYSIDWQFPDTLIKKQWQVSKVFSDTGAHLVSTLKKNKNGDIVSSVKKTFTVLCEIPPSVAIKKATRPRTTAARAQYMALFSNATNDSNYYRYRWSINDSIVAGNRTVNAKSKANNNVKLVVYRDPLKTSCGSDSMVAGFRDEPAVAISVTGDGRLKIVTRTDWKHVLLFWLATLLIPLVAAFGVYRLLKSKKTTKEQRDKPVETGDEGPYSIDFKNHDSAINTESNLEKLTDILRKRQVSDACRLNIRRTINYTVRSGGLPQLAYTPLSRPSDYLVLVEKENNDSHIVKLFEYLFEKLRKEQVNLEVYEYRKEPLYLDNEKLNHSRIPLDRLAALYPDRVLLIFGDSRQFVLALKGVLKDWVSSKLNAWKTKIIVTPYPKNDWDKKEQLLMEAGFTVVPADLDAQVIIDKALNGQIDSQAQSRYIVPESYSARFLNFQEFDTLKEYLNDKVLLRWICSLGIYSSADWNLTIAIGKAIEEDEHNKGRSAELVNYSNLLKLSRISWLQEGLIPDTIKLQMLEYIDNDTENLVRQTLVNELNDLENKILPGSLLKKQFDAHEKINTFLVGAYNNVKPSNKDAAFIKDLLLEGQVDQAQEIYLNSGGNTLVKHPYKKERTISLTHYFSEINTRKKLISRVAATGTFVIVFACTFFLIKSNFEIGRKWNYPVPVSQTFVMDHQRMKLNNYVAAVTFNKFQKNFTLESDTLQINDLTLADSSGTGNFTISDADGAIIARDLFRMNSNLYTVHVSAASMVPVAIYYRSFNDTTLANAIARNLPSSYDVDMLQGTSFDTGINVSYYSDDQKKDAESLTSIINQTFSKQITAEHHTSHIKGDTGKVIAIYVSSLDACTPVSIPALPPYLTGKWQGGTSNRILDINLPQKRIKYSTGDINTFGLYNIDEICLKGNVYKITVKSNSLYKVFFIRNLNIGAFDLSVCQSLYNTKGEVSRMDETYCDRFNLMSKVEDSVRYLNILSRCEGWKASNPELKNPVNAILVTSASSKYFEQKPTRLICKDEIYNANTHYLIAVVTRGSSLQTAFEARRANTKAGGYNVYLHTQAQDESSSAVHSMYFAVPKDRGINGIRLYIDNKPVALQNNTPLFSDNSTEAAKPEKNDLGTILLDGKYYPTAESLKLIDDITTAAQQIKGAQIVLEGTYSGSSELAAVQNAVQTIKGRLLKSGLGPNQVKDFVTERPVQNNAPVQQSTVVTGIKITGNFQLPKKASAY